MASRFESARVVCCISDDSLSDLTRILEQEDWRTFELSGVDVNDKQSFLAGAAKALPFEPGLTAGNSWDAFTDALWGGLAALPNPRVAFIWSDAHNMLDHGLPDLLVAVDCFQHLAAEVSIINHGFPAPMVLRVFLVGNGDNFKLLGS